MAEEIKKAETNAESNEPTATKPKSNLVKYIIYAVSGIVLIGGIAFGTAFMLKSSPKAEEQPAEVSQQDKSNEKQNTENSADSQEMDASATEMISQDEADAEDSGIDTKAIEKIVDNLAQLQYTPNESDLVADNSMSLEDSLAQMSWIESQKLEIAKRQSELDAREKELNRLEKSVDAKIIKIEQSESAKTTQLAQLYDGMDSRAVAKLLMNLDDNTVVAILPRMKTKNASQVLQLLPSKRAADLSKQMITIADK